MIWALLAMLGVPLWLIAGMLVSLVWSRRIRQRADGVFGLAIRPEGEATWPRQLVYGRQIRDILVAYVGLALVRTEFHIVDDVTELELGDRPKRLPNAVGRLLTLDDGTRLEVAVAPQDAAHLDALVRSRTTSSPEGAV